MSLFGKGLNDNAQSRIGLRKPATFAGNETERQRIGPLRAARGTIVVGEGALWGESIDCGGVDGARGLGRSQAAEHQQRRGTSPSAAVGGRHTCKSCDPTAHSIMT